MKIKNVMIKLLIICIIYTAITITPISAEEINVSNEAINKLQDKIDNAGFNWVAGRTSVSDLTTEEKLHLCGLSDDFLHTNHITQIPEISYVHYLDEINWCDKDGENWMTPVKSQGTCGSCWAFSVIGSIETRINIESGYPSNDVDLSEQHLVSDCCNAGDCDGGWPGRAFKYIMLEGISVEKYFPYLGMHSSCTPHPDWVENICTVDDIIYFYTSDSTLKWALENYGPLSICLHVNENDWSYYNSGIFEPIHDYTSNHAVVLVGYNDTGDYWIIKNSWSENWGEDGYMRIKYGSLPIFYYGIVATNITYSIPRDITDNVITIENVTLNYNTTIDIPIRLINSTGVGGCLIELTFDPSIVDVTNVVSGDFDDIFSPNYSNVDTGTLQIACIELGENMIGDLTIATITLNTVGTSGSCTLGLSADLTTANGIVVPSSTNDGIFTISERAPGDVNGDGAVNIGDATLLFNWVSFVNERDTTYALNKPWNANVNGDDRINIGDSVLLFNWVLFPEERGTTYTLQ